MSEENALSIVEGINTTQLGGLIRKIEDFQIVIQKQMRQGHDFGIIPGTPKPTLLKPGAEKINMLMGLTNAYEILDSTRDWQSGFFQYQIKCSLMKNGVVITEGLGACNTRERKYAKLDPYDFDNTVLKMAKKRALIDATLHVASLSDIFTQDIEDLDLQGERVSQTRKTYTDTSGTITQAQAKRMFAISKGNGDLVKAVMTETGYDPKAKSTDVQKIHYEDICKEIEKRANEKEE